MQCSDLNKDYLAHKPAADAFLSEFMHQFHALIKKTDVKLGVPLEGRVKEWASIEEKLTRKAMDLTSCRELKDLIGVRAITLFKRDAHTLCRLIEKTFNVSSKEDKEKELDAARFGYISQHLIVRIPKTWGQTPAFSGLDFSVEIQIRTLSQHIWAASSHLLQYKKEADVPLEVSRSIHRVAALLETVDLEFERVLDERDTYTKSRKATSPQTPLDTDNIQIILRDFFPPENIVGNEIYSELLSDLKAFGIKTVDELKKLAAKHVKAAIIKDKQRVDKLKKEPDPYITSVERIRRGVFFSHVGLARQLLSEEFGEKWKDYISGAYPTVEVDPPQLH